MQLFIPESFAAVAVPSNQMRAATAATTSSNEELFPGCPIRRWKRGKYDRRKAAQRRQSAHQWALVRRVVGVVTSTLVLALVFSWAGVH